MGMYDTVRVPCPKCGTREDFQSKSGECNLDVFPLEKAPKSVLINGKSVEVDPENYNKAIDR